MTTYAVLNSNIVENIIIADSKEIAENVTKKLCIEITQIKPVQIGDIYEDNIFWSTKPYPSWIKGKTDWEAPIPYPNDNKMYSWNESTLSWEEVVL